MGQLLSGILLLAGSIFVLLASVGLHRFEDLYSRIHAATKATTLGMLLTAAGAALQVAGWGDVAKLVLAGLLQLVSAPVSAHMVGRAAYRTGSVVSPGTTVDDLADADLNGD